MKKFLLIFTVVFTAFHSFSQLPSYLPSNGLVAWYPFNGNANDESGNGNNGTVNGATLTTDRFGNSGKAYSFNGSNNWIKLPGSIQPSKISAGVWFKMNSSTFYQYILRNRLYGFEISFTSKLRTELYTSTSNLYTKEYTNNINDGNWHFVMFTFDGNIYSSYIDGVLSFQSNSQGSGNVFYLNNGNGFALGRDGDASSGYFDGFIDDLVVYNRALTQQEITQLYTGVTPTHADVITNNDTTICKGNSVTLSAKETLPVTDNDGNIYPTVKIGFQIWSAKNLNVSKYKNGDIIPQVTNPTQWANLTTGAWCWYNNDSLNYSKYGKLYNWYAVNDQRGLAPEGWHVPSDGEWNKMVKHLDMFADTICLNCWQSNTVGNILKSTRGWNNDGNGMDNLGFEGLPGGYCYGFSEYLNIGNIGYWWSTSENNNSNAYLRLLRNSSLGIARYESIKSSGFSIRFLRNDYNFEYLWSNGETTQSINVSPDVTTTYYCTISDGTNSYIDSLIVNVYNPNIFSQDSIKICDPSYTLDAGSGYNSYSWNTGATNQTINVTSSGWYKCNVSNGICTATDSVFVSLLNVRILNNDTTICRGSSINLTAQGQEPNIVSDIDGNNYHVKQIGNQFWFVENLKTTRFSNGESILNITDPSWQNTLNPAWAYYNNDSVYNFLYGKLYNYYVASDSRNACPLNWHVPTLNDFNILLDYLGGSSVAGGKIKDTVNWILPNVGATNSSGFKAEPAGLKYMGGPFGGIGGATSWWTSTQSPDNPSMGKAKFINNGIDSVIDYDDWKNVGWSIRCLKNSPNSPIISHTYLWSTGDTTATINVSPTQTTTYYCTVSNGISSCLDSVTVTVNNCGNFCDSVGIINNDTTICRGSSLTLSVGTTSSNNQNLNLPSNLQNGLVGYWPFNGNANDESGNGNNGTVNGATLTLDRFGNPGKAYNFNGTTSNYISVGNVNITDDFTVSFWEKSDLTQFANEIGFGRNASNSIDVYNGYGVSMNGADVSCEISPKVRCVFDAVSTCQNTIVTTDTVVNNIWNNIVVSRQGVLVKIYVNGILKASGSNLILFALSDVIFGMRSDVFAPFKGQLDDIRIWNRALSSSEIQQIYSGVTYLWSTGDTTATINVSPTQTTTYYCTVSNGISSCADSVKVTVNSIPTLTYNATSSDCVSSNNGSVQLIADSQEGVAGFSFNGSSLSQNSNYTNLSPGNYPAYVTSLNGCSSPVTNIAIGYTSMNCDTVVNVCANPCVTLNAIVPDLRASTEDYTITREYRVLADTIPSPVVGGYPTALTTDDKYSTLIDIPFSFRFYDDPTPYTQLLASTNGYICFDPAEESGFSHYGILNGNGFLSATSGTPQDLPSSLYDRSVIFGPYHDLDPNYTTSPERIVKYDLMGTAPNRRFVLSFYKVPLFGSSYGCDTLFENTHQIALYEGTNVIEVYLKSVQQCEGWNEGRAMVGIQNYNRDKGIVAPDRAASDAPWGTPNMNECWRFTPSAGPSLLNSVKLYDFSGNLIAVGDTSIHTGGNVNVTFPNVCVSQTTSFLVKMEYASTIDAQSFVYYYDTIVVRAYNPFQESYNPLPDTIRACGTNYQLDAGNGYNSYQWTNGASSQNIEATTSGWYKCTVSNGSCTATDSVFVSLVNANIVNGDTAICRGSTLTLYAVSLPNSNGVTDFDGNNYPTINIGTQTWAQKNLIVSHYRNGDIIPQVTDPTEWANLTTGAWCWYNNDSAAYGATYGKLYNVFAVNDSRGLAPNGCHIPSSHEWNLLALKVDPLSDTNNTTNFQDYYISDVGGSKLKEAGNTHWTTADPQAFNEFGFSALPSGFYLSNSNGGTQANFWTSTKYVNLNSWNLTRSITSGIFQWIDWGQSFFGHAVRLIKDNQSQAGNLTYLWSTGDTTATINVSPTQTTTYYCTVSNGISSCVDSVTVTVKNTSVSSTNQSACNSYTWNGQTYTESGTYTFTTTNSVGCDSIATLNLTISRTSISTSNQTACNSFNWNGVTYTESGTYTYATTSSAGCDSLATLNLTINSSTVSTLNQTACNSYTWNGQTYSTSGIYIFTGTNSVGCDSIATLNLIINQPTASISNQTACNSFSWNGQTYTASGTYSYTTTNSLECDSVATLNLIINNTSTSTTNQTACDSYVWNGATYTESGIYTWFGTNAVGCDSIATLNLTINRSTFSSLNQIACESYSWNGTTYTESGVYSFTTTNEIGCDSTATLNLTINRTTTSTLNLTACDSYVWNGVAYTESGTYTWLGTNIFGCDSTASLVLTINYSATSNINVTACGNYFWNGNNYTTSGVYVFNTTTTSGCDSVITMDLTLLPALQLPIFYVTQPTGNDLYGSILISSPLGAEFTYSVDGATFQSNPDFNNLIPGIYNIVLKNGIGCVSAPITVYIMPSTQAGIYHSSASCNDFSNGRAEAIDQLCYKTTANAVSNVTPGMMVYSMKFKAPFVNFCIDVKQKRTDSSFTKLNIHQTNQIKILEANCRPISTGVTIAPGEGRVCVENAVIGSDYILTVKYDPKTAIGSIFSGVPPEVWYGFESQVNGQTLPGSATSIKMTPGCNDDRPYNWNPQITGNPTSSQMVLTLTTDFDEVSNVRVVDVMGRLVSQFKIEPNTNYYYGSNLKRGVYFIEFTQGDNRKTLKAIKF